LNLLKFAAIDVGSNAARLLVSTVMDGKEPFFKKSSLVRVPLRLGFDAFKTGKISDRNVERFLHTMEAFSHLINAHEVDTFRACATSAMREAENGPEIVKEIKRRTGIKLEIIDGEAEAEVLHATKVKSKMVADTPYLYIDVGGGSTEITLILNEETIASKSFKIGTIRLLQDQVSKESWKKLENWVEKKTKNHNKIVAVGTGGNINKLFKISEQKLGMPMSRANLESIHKGICKLSFNQRMKQYNMKTDRADVVEPAGKIYLSIMHAAGSKQILVPKVGLADGLIRLMYKETKSKGVLS